MLVSQIEKREQKTQQKQRSHSEIMDLAASWYIAMRSKELKKKPKAIELFSQPLVAWRDQEGNPVIMERFCAHMGASLALGKLKDGCVQCPFHHWKFDSTGKCVSIPEIDKIPVTARQRTYVTAERYGFIWIWYGTETPLFSLPEFPPVESEKQNYIPLRVVFDAQTTVCRVLENPYDQSHIVGLHQLKTTVPVQLTILDTQNYEQPKKLPIEKEAWLGVVIEAHLQRYIGPVSWLVQAFGLKTEKFTLKIDSWPTGHLATILINGKEVYKSLSGIIPVNENKVVWDSIYTIKKTGNFILDLLYYVLFGYQTAVGAAEDVPIWNTLNQNKGGAYVKTDRGVLKFREFYQHWVDRVESTSIFNNECVDIHEETGNSRNI